MDQILEHNARACENLAVVHGLVFSTKSQLLCRPGVPLLPSNIAASISVVWWYWWWFAWTPIFCSWTNLKANQWAALCVGWFASNRCVFRGTFSGSTAVKKHVCRPRWTPSPPGKWPPSVTRSCSQTLIQHDVCNQSIRNVFAHCSATWSDRNSSIMTLDWSHVLSSVSVFENGSGNEIVPNLFIAHFLSSRTTRQSGQQILRHLASKHYNENCSIFFSVHCRKS